MDGFLECFFELLVGLIEIVFTVAIENRREKWGRDKYVC